MTERTETLDALARRYADKVRECAWLRADRARLRDREYNLARENYGLLLILRDEVGEVSSDSYRATAESKVNAVLGPPRPPSAAALTPTGDTTEEPSDAK